MEGTKLGKYEIRATLGRGAMGTVYEAWDPVIKREVAIKTVRLPATNDTESLEMMDRFRGEAQSAGRLNHPNIVGVFDYGEAEGLAYIVMEFVKGRSLKSIIDSGEHLELADVLRVMEDLLAGLQYSHEHGVIHRDIKPANIMLTPDGRAKIADFGVARIENSAITQAGTVIGTPAYMSPEQFMGQKADPRSDIYSAGVVLYQLLTGERPFDGTQTSIMHKVLYTHPPRPSELSVVAPPSVDAVVERAMARRPEDRYPQAADFAAALRQAMQTGPVPYAAVGQPMDETATVITRPGAATRTQGASVTHSRPIFSRVLVGVAILAILLAGLGAWFVFERHEPPTTASKVAQAPAPPSSQTPAQPPPKSQPGAERTNPSQALTPVAPLSPQKSPEPSLPSDTVATTQQQPQYIPPTRLTEEPATDRSPPGVSPPTKDERVVPPTRLTMVIPPPAELRRAVRDAIAPVDCALASGDVIREGNALELTGMVAVNSEASLRAAVARAAPMLSIEWHVETFSEPYCETLELVRPFAAKFGMPHSGLALSTVDGRTHLWEGDRIVLRISAPNFRSWVQLDDLQSDGSVYHMQPSPGYPASSYEPLSRQSWGDARSGVADLPVVQSPFGTDMIIAIASERPLFVEARPAVEKIDVYLRDLRAEIGAARARREIVTAAALILTTSKRR